MQTKRYSSVEVEINLRADAPRELFYCPLGPADELHRRHIWAKIRKNQRQLARSRSHLPAWALGTITFLPSFLAGQKCELLLVSERNDRIDEHRPPRRQIARRKRNRAKQDRNRRERRRVRRADAEKQAFDQFRQQSG